jgi:ABC-2 type transport system permease protein
VASPYLHLLRGQIRSQTAYRRSFGIDVFSSIWYTVFDVVAVLVLFRVTTALGGFTVREALVIVALASTAFAAADLAVGQIDELRQHVRIGRLDTLLVRPLRALPQLLLAEVSLQRIGRVGFGAAVYLVALLLAPIEWNLARLGLVVLAPLAGAVFYSAVFVAASTVAFWWVESGELGNSLTFGGRDAASYPMTIYSGLFRRVFGLGLGFAFVAYYPALALLGRADPLGLPARVGWLSPAVTVPAVTVAWLCWRTGIRHYRSTGS